MANGFDRHRALREGLARQRGNLQGSASSRARAARDRALLLAQGTVGDRNNLLPAPVDVGTVGAGARDARNRTRRLVESVAEDPIGGHFGSTVGTGAGVTETSEFHLHEDSPGRFPWLRAGQLTESFHSGVRCSYREMSRLPCPTRPEGPVLCPVTRVVQGGEEQFEPSGVASLPPVWIAARGQEPAHWDPEGRRSHLFVLPASGMDEHPWQYLELMVCVDWVVEGQPGGRLLVEAIASTPYWWVGCSDILERAADRGDCCKAGMKAVEIHQRIRGLRVQANETTQRGGHPEAAAAVVQAGMRGNFILKPPTNAYGVELILTPIAAWEGHAEEVNPDPPPSRPPNYTWRLGLAGDGLLREDYRDAVSHPDVPTNHPDYVAPATVVTIGREAQGDHLFEWLDENSRTSPADPPTPPYC